MENDRKIDELEGQFGEADYRAIFDAVNDAIFITDIESGAIVDANQKACEMFCYPKEQLIGLTVADLSLGEAPYSEAEANRFLRAAAEGEPQLFEWHAKDKAGRSFWVEINLKRAVIRGKYRLLAIVRDVTDRKSAEEELQLARFSIERVADPIFWIGPEADILYVNDMACKALGYTEDELLSMTVHDIDPNFPKEVWGNHWKEIKERGHFTFETKHRRKDGSTFPVEVSINYLEFQGQEYNCAFARNITERKKQEEVLLKRDYQLEILSRTSQHINATLEIPVIMRTLVAAGMELVDGSAGVSGLSIDGVVTFREYNKEGRLIPINYSFAQGCGIPGSLAKSMKPYISNNAKDDTKVNPEKCKTFDLRNLVSVPVLSGDSKLIGCFEIYNKKSDLPFDVQDVFMLQGLAASAAVALENAKMFIENKKTSEALKESEETYRSTIDAILTAIHLVDPQMRIIMLNKELKRFNARLGLETDVIGKNLYKVYPFLANKIRDEYKKVFSVGKPIFTEEEHEINGHKIFAEVRKIPIFEQDKVVRVVTVVRDITERKSTEQELKVLNKELVNTNKLLQQVALKDPQTGLYNHHYLAEVIETELYRAKRYAHPLSLIMIDIDYFKSVNDVYGHEFGDLVLDQFTKVMKKLIRRYDMAVRFGGEEFVILSPSVDRYKTLMQAQRILNTINLRTFGNKKCSVKLKLSIAVSSYPEDAVTKGMDLVDLADKILDKVKEEGGNRIYSSSDIKKSKAAVPLRAPESTDVKFLRDKIERLTKHGKRNLIESISAFARTIELKDHYTGEHVENTVYYATAIARALGLSFEEIENIKEGAVLHDLGKVGVSDKILHKKTSLTKKEFDEIKKHPQIAADIIRPIQFMHDIVPLILYHHERWDGKGYPAGLKKEEIPLGARIIALADVYQALTSNRPYRKAYSKKKAMEIIKSESGTHFDPDVVNALLKILKKEN